MVAISTLTAFLMTAFSLAELGDGFGMFFDMYLLGLGWTETSVIISGIMRGVVELSFKGVVGDIIDKTHHDRRIFLGVASVTVALSSLMIFFVNGADEEDRIIVYAVRSLESVALAFLGPAFQAVTLSAFGPEMFDGMQVKREIVSHGGDFFSKILSGAMAWFLYPDIEWLFVLPAAFAVSAVYFVRYIPRGDPLMGRAFHLKTEARDEAGCVVDTHEGEAEPEAASYWEVFLDKRIMGIVLADVFHVLAEANVGLVFNEALADVGTWSGGDDDDGGGGGDDDDGGDDDGAVMSRSAIPLLATAGSAAQIVMIAGTLLVGHLTNKGWGRKPFYIAHLCVHPVRVLLIGLCLWTGAGKGWLVSTEFVGGLTGAFGIVNAFMRADILFGSGRFNVVDGFQATIRGVAATSSAYVGAYILENNGPMTALGISFVFAVIPPVIGYLLVPETLGMREKDFKEEKRDEMMILKSFSNAEGLTGHHHDDQDLDGSGGYVEMSAGPILGGVATTAGLENINDSVWNDAPPQTASVGLMVHHQDGQDHDGSGGYVAMPAGTMPGGAATTAGFENINNNVRNDGLIQRASVEKGEFM